MAVAVRVRPASTRWLLIAGGGVMVAAGLLVATSGLDVWAFEEAELGEARRQLADIRQELREAEDVADTAQAELEAAERLLQRLEAVVNDVATAVDGQVSVVARAEQRLDVMEAERDVLVEAFNRRATRMFKLGPTRSIDLMLSGQDASDAMARSAYLRVVLAGDQVDLEVLEASEIAVAAERRRAEQERTRLAALLEEQKQLFAQAEELREHRALAAADARDRVRLLEEQQDDLESEQSRIEAVIERQQAEERRRRAAARNSAPDAQNQAPPSQTSGAGYAWPLCAPVTSGYGPRWGRMHRGVDLGAPTGTPVGASKAGSVIFANWQGGYGRLVLIDHGDGVVTAYAHLSSFSVSPGGSVQRGQTIGRVGTTGNSTGPHLHLEFRVNGHAVNPRQYLSGRPC